MNVVARILAQGLSNFSLKLRSRKRAGTVAAALVAIAADRESISGKAPKKRRHRPVEELHF